MAMGSGYLEPLIPRTQRQAKLASKWSWYSSTLTASSGLFGSCKSFLLTIVRSAAGRVIAEFHIGIRPTQLPERPPPLLGEGSAPALLHDLRRLTIHWCPGSLSILGLDLAELFFHDAINSGRFLVQVTEFAERLHPGIHEYCFMLAIARERFCSRVITPAQTMGWRVCPSAERFVSLMVPKKTNRLVIAAYQ
jgi:hypothetical protein